MRPGLLCLGLLAVATPAFPQAITPGQLFLNITDCSHSASRNKDLNCSNSTSNMVLVPTAMPTSDVDGVMADLGYIDIVVGTDPSSMPPYWQWQTGGCAGSGRIVFSADFSANTQCADVWAGQGNTGGQWGGATGPVPDGNRARVKWTTNVLPEMNFPIAGGTEAYIEKITLRQPPVGTCAGCNTRACAVYLSEQLYLFAGGYVEIAGGNAGSEWLTFNDSANSIGCLITDQARKSTWGQVKSLYR